MRSASVWFTGPRRVEVRDGALPPPGEGEVVVATVASAISAGTELLIYRGEAPNDLASDEALPTLTGDLGYPLRYGYACVGRVEQLGPGVDPAWAGRLVFAFQPHTSCFSAHVTTLQPLPPDLPPEEALFLANMESAVNLVHDGAPRLGERIAVYGQGIVGLLTVALLARLSPARLVSLDRHARRRELSMALGATASLDPLAADAPASVRAALGGAGADLVYELSGVPAALDAAVAAAGFDSRVVVGSWYGTKAATLNLGGRFHRDRIRLISSQVSTLAPALTGRWTKARRLELAWSLLDSLRPSRLITHRMPIDEAPTAYALLDTRQDQAVQVILTYDGDT